MDGLRPAHTLVQRYLSRVKEVVRYSTMDVLEPAWQLMEERLRRAADLDDVSGEDARGTSPLFHCTPPMRVYPLAFNPVAINLVLFLWPSIL